MFFCAVSISGRSAFPTRGLSKEEDGASVIIVSFNFDLLSSYRRRDDAVSLINGGGLSVYLQRSGLIVIAVKWPVKKV